MSYIESINNSLHQLRERDAKKQSEYKAEVQAVDSAYKQASQDTEYLDKLYNYYNGFEKRIGQFIKSMRERICALPQRYNINEFRGTVDISADIENLGLEQYSAGLISRCNAEISKITEQSNPQDDIKATEKLSEYYAEICEVNKQLEKLYYTYIRTPNMMQAAKEAYYDDLERFKCDVDKETAAAYATALFEIKKNKIEYQKIADRFIEERFVAQIGRQFVGFPSSICLGEILHPIIDYRKDIVIKALSCGNADKLPIAFEMPLVGHFDEYENDNEYDNCNVVFDWDGKGDAIYSLMENWIVKFASSFPVRYMELFVFHSVTGSPLGAIVGELSRAIGNELTHGGVISKSNVGRELENISNIINSRIADYGKRFKNIVEYNQAAPDNAQSAIFCIICDYPTGFSEENQNEILDIMDKGNRCGVYTILIRNSSLPALGSEYRKKQEILDSLETTLLIEAKDNKFYINGFEYVFNLGGDQSQMTELLDSLKESKKQKSPPIPLHSLQLPSRKYGNDFSENLCVPVGKEGSQIQCVEMSPNDQTVHLLVAGMTGSGKSVFLHTFILSAANMYSPSELEFYLIDLKDGVEFNLYRDVLKIPHVKMLAVNEGDIQITYEMLNALSEEMTRRNEIFKRLNARNIIEYNARVIAKEYDKEKFGELKPIPRAVVIIDEYQDIFAASGKYSSMCIEELKAMAKKARSTGMGLLLSSQTVPSSGFGDIKEQIDNIVLFNAKEETIDKLLPGMSKYRNDLSREKGNAFYTSRGAKPILFRAAYPGERTNDGEDGLYANAKRINAKYKDSVGDIIIAGENLELPVMQSRLNFVTGDTMPLQRSGDEADLTYGQSARTGYRQTVKFKSSAAVLPVLGDAVQSKSIEMTLLLSALYESKLNATNDDIYYLDCNPVRKKNIITEMSACNKFRYFSGIDNCSKLIGELKRTIEIRANDGFKNNMLIFIHRAVALSDTSNTVAPMSAEEKFRMSLGATPTRSGGVLAELGSIIKEAGHAGVFVVIQVDNDKDYRLVFGKDTNPRHMLFTSGAEVKSALDSYLDVPLGNEDKGTISRDDICTVYAYGESYSKARKMVYDSEAILQLIDIIGGNKH